jgi:hypothetical protein
MTEKSADNQSFAEHARPEAPVPVLGAETVRGFSVTGRRARMER